MLRILLVLAAGVCIWFGAQQWLAQPSAERPLAGNVQEALARLDRGEGAVPLRIERAPAAPMRLAATGLERPPYAECRDEARELREGCVGEIAGAIEPVGLLLEARVGTGAEAAICARHLFQPIAGTERTRWASKPLTALAPHSDCSNTVRAGFPWALPRQRQLRTRSVQGGELAALGANGITGPGALRGRVSRASTLVENLWWFDFRPGAEDRAAFEQGLRAMLPRQESFEATLLLVPERASARPGYVSLDDAGTLFRVDGTRPVSLPALGVVRAPDPSIETALRRSLSDNSRKLGIWSAIAPEAADAQARQLAHFALGLGIALLLIAAGIHWRVSARR